MRTHDQHAAIRAEIQGFHSRFQTLHLASCDIAGLAEASYAPFVAHEKNFYVYLSELAVHCTNLRTTQRCSAMWIEGEEQAKHPFARKRLTLQCSTKDVPRSSSHFEQVLGLFHGKFGQFMDLIAPLNDFHLYALEPTSGRFVAGFAKAYRLEGKDLTHIHHRIEKGHGSKASAAIAAVVPL